MLAPTCSINRLSTEPAAGHYATEFYIDWRGRKFQEDYRAHIVEGLDKAGFAVTDTRIDR